MHNLAIDPFPSVTGRCAIKPRSAGHLHVGHMSPLIEAPMKRWPNFISFTLCFLAFHLSGCSATGARFNGVAELPVNQAEVYIYRTGKFIGGAKPFEIVVDGKRVASLKNAGYVKFLLAPGYHKIVAQPEILQTLSMSSATAEKNLLVEPQKRYFLAFSINSSVSGDTYYIRRNSLHETNEQAALETLSTLNYSE